MVTKPTNWSNPAALRTRPGTTVSDDPAAAKKLFEAHGVHFDPKLRDQVVARVEALHLPSYTGFVMPKLTPVRGADGGITDVAISYPMDLTAQMLEYASVRRQ